jgi:hypothetical protein
MTGVPISPPLRVTFWPESAQDICREVISYLILAGFGLKCHVTLLPHQRSQTARLVFFDSSPRFCVTSALAK